MKYCIYTRISTDKQNEGFTGQLNSIENYLGSPRFAKAKEIYLKQKFYDIASGKNEKRPGLQRVIEYSKKNNSVIVVANLSRFSRSLSFTSSLEKKKLRVLDVSQPKAPEVLRNITAVFNQFERKEIGRRTKAGLAHKAGKKILGSYHPKTRLALEKLWAERRRIKDLKKKKKPARRLKVKTPRLSKTKAFDSQVLPAIKLGRELGLNWVQVVERLNKAGVQTRRGRGKWYLTQVLRIAKRADLVA